MNLAAINRLFTNDQEVRLYRPILKRITGSTNSAILLSQMIYWSSTVNNDWFYKFNGKCEHKLYKNGDSWEEELEFSLKELQSAKKKITFTVGDKTTKDYRKKYGEGWEEELQNSIDDALIISYQTPDRLTYYKVNMVKINDSLSKIYKEKDSENGVVAQQNQLMPNIGFSFSLESNNKPYGNQEGKELPTSVGQQNQLMYKRGITECTKGALDISKNTAKNTTNTQEGICVSLLEEKELQNELQKQLKETMHLQPVSLAVKKIGHSTIVVGSILVPLAKQHGKQAIINILKDIKVEGNVNPIKDLKGLIISRI